MTLVLVPILAQKYNYFLYFPNVTRKSNKNVGFWCSFKKCINIHLDWSSVKTVTNSQ